MQGNFSKTREIFDSRRSVTTTEDQGQGQWEQYIDLGQRCELIDNKHQKTRVIED